MRELDNIRQVAGLNIHWIGFIFYRKSKRYMQYELPMINRRIKKVGVFVNATLQEITETALYYHLDYLQLHGNETSETCAILKSKGYSIIKAFSVGTEEDIKQTDGYEGIVDHFLFDTKCEGFGGSGKSFDWSILSEYKGNTPFLLSGGITSKSIEDIKNFHHPLFAGIDLNSGFETEPGLKDIKKLDSFINKIRN